MAQQGKQKRAREYLRVSADKRGRLESPAEQHDVNQRHAGENGWTLGEAYAEDAAVSASRYSRKARDAFGRLVADIEGGAFGADILMIWESSRGSRRVSEWARLIDACADAGVCIYVTSHGRLYDPRKGRDRRSLHEDATDSEYESDKLSERASRTTAARAAAGKAHGKVPYGYRRVYHPVTRELVRQEPDPDEAPVVRELFARLAAGGSFKGIARDFGERGLTTRGSAKFPPRPFSPEHLRSMALNVTYAGKRTHRPNGTARRPGSLDGAVDGTWPPLVDDVTFAKVHALLTDSSRRTSRPGRGKHELSLIARCDICGGPLTVTYRTNRNGQRAYFCREKSCVHIPAADLDAYAADVMCAYLDEPENARQLTVRDTGPELDAVREELETARAELRDWRARARRREITAASFAEIEPAIAAEVARLEEREKRLQVPPELAGFADGHASYRAAWDAADTATRRRVARLLCQPRYLGWLKVGRSPVPGHSVPAWQRATWDFG